jgi:hypothetical protein
MSEAWTVPSSSIQFKPKFTLDQRDIAISSIPFTQRHYTPFDPAYSFHLEWSSLGLVWRNRNASAEFN